MKVIIDYIQLSSDPKDVIQNMKKQMDEKASEGLELKSHVPDGVGNLIMTYQKSKPENLYKYHTECVTVDVDPKITLAKMNEVNERLERIGYTQKSMFLDGHGHFIVTYLINTKKNGGNKIQKAKGQGNRNIRPQR